jgi:hypothetical protein
MYSLVRTLKIVMVSLLALTWVSLTSHCRLEAVPGFEFLRCASDSDAAHPDEGGDPCQEGACCSVESSHCQAPRQQEIVAAVLPAILPQLYADVPNASLPSEINLGVPKAAPPEIPKSWQFSLRTALPVRAPSLAS